MVPVLQYTQMRIGAMVFRHILSRFRPRIFAREARELLRGGAVLVDARPDRQWHAVRAAGAVDIPLDELADRAGSLPAARTIVVLGCSRVDGRVAVRIPRRHGLAAYAVQGGLHDWESSGADVARGGVITVGGALDRTPAGQCSHRRKAPGEARISEACDR
jgi:rhodanese-related sulfurtransferase